VIAFMALACDYAMAAYKLSGCLAVGPGRFDLRTTPDQIYFVEVDRAVMGQIKALQGEVPLWVTPVQVKASPRKHPQAGPAGKYGAIAKVTELAVSDDRTLCHCVGIARLVPRVAMQYAFAHDYMPHATLPGRFRAAAVLPAGGCIGPDGYHRRG
jgi:hypothetical protein